MASDVRSTHRQSISFVSGSELVSPILFLDFDGVLHPAGAHSAKFSRLDLLSVVLREPGMVDVRIVVSSTWREIHSLKALRAFFPADLQPRIIGSTPVLDEHDTNFHRSEEIEAWLEEHPEVQRWAALDDDIQGFAARLKHRAVFTDGATGLTASSIAALRALFGG